jgi:hypothetical protein
MKNYPPIIKLDKIPKTQIEINVIKNQFLHKDIKYKNIPYLGAMDSIDIEETTISVEVVYLSSTNIKDEFGFEEEFLENDLVECEFQEEFERSLDVLLISAFESFKNLLDTKGVYTSDAIEGLKKRRLKKVNELVSFYEEESDIIEPLKNVLIEFCNKYYEFVSNFDIEDHQISDKFKFALNKNELILLFQTMLDKDVITGIPQNDMYRLLEQKTLYKVSKGEYAEMKNVRLQANKLQKGYVSSETSLNKLCSIFHKTFFTSSQ